MLVQIEIDGPEVTVKVVGKKPWRGPDVIGLGGSTVPDRPATEDYLTEDGSNEPVVVVFMFSAVEAALNQRANHSLKPLFDFSSFLRAFNFSCVSNKCSRRDGNGQVESAVAIHDLITYLQEGPIIVEIGCNREAKLVVGADLRSDDLCGAVRVDLLPDDFFLGVDGSDPFARGCEEAAVFEEDFGGNVVGYRGEFRLGG